MKQRTRSKRSISGFTLIEMLVVIIIIAVLFAIAAPGWDTLLSRQRISAAREQVAQTIRMAQSEAKRTRAPRIVVFDANNGKPRVATAPYIAGTPLPISTNSVSTWVLLNNGDVNAGTIKLATSGTSAVNNALVFDGNGAIAQMPTVPSSQVLPFGITISRGNVTNRTTDRCIVVETILGAFHTEEGALNGSKGCPP